MDLGQCFASCSSKVQIISCNSLPSACDWRLLVDFLPVGFGSLLSVSKGIANIPSSLLETVEAVFSNSYSILATFGFSLWSTRKLWNKAAALIMVEDVFRECWRGLQNKPHRIIISPKKHSIVSLNSNAANCMHLHESMVVHYHMVLGEMLT